MWWGRWVGAGGIERRTFSVHELLDPGIDVQETKVELCCGQAARVEWVCLRRTGGEQCGPLGTVRDRVWLAERIVARARKLKVERDVGLSDERDLSKVAASAAILHRVPWQVLGGVCDDQVLRRGRAGLKLARIGLRDGRGRGGRDCSRPASRAALQTCRRLLPLLSVAASSPNLAADWFNPAVRRGCCGCATRWPSTRVPQLTPSPIRSMWEVCGHLGALPSLPPL